MRNFHNIESRKLDPRHEYYVAYGGGHVWRVERNRYGRNEWIAASNTAPFTLRGRVLADISLKLENLIA